MAGRRKSMLLDIGEEEEWRHLWLPERNQGAKQHPETKGAGGSSVHSRESGGRVGEDAQRGASSDGCESVLRGPAMSATLGRVWKCQLWGHTQSPSQKRSEDHHFVLTSRPSDSDAYSTWEPQMCLFQSLCLTSWSETMEWNVLSKMHFFSLQTY